MTPEGHLVCPKIQSYCCWISYSPHPYSKFLSFLLVHFHIFCPQWHIAMTSEMTRGSFAYTNNVIVLAANISGLKNTYIYLIARVTPSWAFFSNLTFPLVFTHPSCFQIITASFPVPFTFIQPSNSCLFKWIHINHIFPQKSKGICDALLGSSVLATFKTPNHFLWLGICCYRIHIIPK